MRLNVPFKTDVFERMGYPFAVFHRTVDRERSCNHTAIIGDDIDPTQIAGTAGTFCISNLSDVIYHTINRKLLLTINCLKNTQLPAKQNVRSF